MASPWSFGAAPGGWSQIAAKRVGAVSGKGSVVAIDPSEMPEIPGVNFAQLDFLAENAPEKLIAMMGGRADVVMSDMALEHHGPPQDRSVAYRRPDRNGGRVCDRCAQPRRNVPGQGLSERRRCRTGRAIETRFCQRASCQAGLEPAGFVGALCAGDGVSRAVQSGVGTAFAGDDDDMPRLCAGLNRSVRDEQIPETSGTFSRIWRILSCPARSVQLHAV